MASIRSAIRASVCTPIIATMDDGLPSISSGAVGSRFVSQSDIELAQAKRDEQWKAAYARYAASSSLVRAIWRRPDSPRRSLGQEPPPRPVEDVYDGRSLAEVSRSSLCDCGAVKLTWL